MTGLPEPKTLIDFLLEARPFMEQSPGPTVVHCSPGTGRTGTLIAIDIQMLSYDDTKIVDVIDCVTRLRQDRHGAVQTKEQYAFIYKVTEAHL
jgi:protein tyrosine phosphatase